MRMDTPVANGDPTLAALIPEGVTLAHIIALFHDAYPVNGVQLLRARLGATHPTNLAPPELAEFIKYVLAALKSAGIRDPAAVLAYGVRREAEAAAAKLGSSAAIGDIAARTEIRRACPGHDRGQLIDDLRCIDAAAGGTNHCIRDDESRGRAAA